MTIKEEAQVILDSFIQLNYQHSVDIGEEHGMSHEYHKKCAILHVDGILKALEEYNNRMEEFLKGYFGERYFTIENQDMAILVFRKRKIFEYWSEVKKELELL